MKKLFLLFFISLHFWANAQTAGDVALSFPTLNGFNAAINAIVVQPDGKIIVGGNFTSYNGKTENRIIRLNSNGTKDDTFVTGKAFSGLNSFVHCMALQSDGKILVGGNFAGYNGTNAYRIIRLNSNGSVDTIFNNITGGGFNKNSNVYSIALQSDGKILVGGDFTTYQGSIAANRIIRLNADGSKDTNFDTGASTFLGFDNTVRSIVVQNDGKILVGGDFTKYRGSNANYITRLNTNGLIDETFNTLAGFNNTVRSIALQSDGKILVGGLFTTYKGVTENRIIRLNNDGSKDADFVTNAGFNYGVHTMSVQNNGKILVGGTFLSYQGITENRIIRLNTDGSKDTTFNAGTGFNGTVNCITLQSDGKILVGGFFTTYKDTTDSAYIIVLHPETNLSTDDFEAVNDFSVYPNPTRDVLNIVSKGDRSILSAKIFDLQGKLILGTQNTSIDVQNLSSGLYLVKIETESGAITKKFTKQ